MLRIAPRHEGGPAEDLEQAQERIAQYRTKAPPPPKEAEPPKFKDLSGAPEGAKAQGEDQEGRGQQCGAVPEGPTERWAREGWPQARASHGAEIREGAAGVSGRGRHGRLRGGHRLAPGPAELQHPILDRAALDQPQVPHVVLMQAPGEL